LFKAVKLNVAFAPPAVHADNPAPLAIGSGSIVMVWMQVVSTVPPEDTVKVTVTDPLGVKKPQVPGTSVSCTGPVYVPDDGPEITALAVLDVRVNW